MSGTPTNRGLVGSLLVACACTWQGACSIAINDVKASSDSGIANADSARGRDATCGLQSVAFCDSFEKKGDGVRSGELDPAIWSVSRTTYQANAPQGERDQWPIGTGEICGTPRQRILPPTDIARCQGKDAMGAPSFGLVDFLAEGGQGVFHSMRIRQPFDFAARTGRITFDAAITRDSGVIAVWVTDEPIPAPRDKPEPRNALRFVIDTESCGGEAAVRDVAVFKDRSIRERKRTLDFEGDCFALTTDTLARIEVRVSTQEIEVVTGTSATNTKRLARVADLGLNFARGYVSFGREHTSKALSSAIRWDNIGFDGPLLPTPRAYDVAHANSEARDPSTVNLGYATALLQDFRLQNVDKAGAARARINWMAWQWDGATKLRYRLNSGTWHEAPIGPGEAAYDARSASVEVAIDEIKQGENLLELQSEGSGYIVVNNVDLTLE